MSRAVPSTLLAGAWSELRRRKVVRAGGTYAVCAWMVLQLAEITFEPLGLPERALTWTILGAILGLPLVLVLAWFFDVGPGGLTRDRSPAARAGAVFAVLLVVLTVIGVGSWLFRVYPATPAAEATSAAPPNSIAVLPFADMSPDQDQAYLGDGIAEELLDRLARNSGLRVAARTSSFALRGQRSDIREVGRLLGVRWVLEGSVRKAAGRLRITAQLIDAGSGFHQWSETYDRNDDDLFALQDEVSTAIAVQLQSFVRADGGAQVAAGPADSTDAEAHESFLRGRQLWRQRTPDALDRAEQLFQHAVELDPHFARAWAALADTWLLQASYGSRSQAEAVRLAEPAAVRAVTIAPQLGEAWASLGLLRMTAGQLPAAERSLREAIRLDPRYEMAPTWLANVLRLRGDVKEQEAVLRQALQINPLEPVINGNLAWVLGQRGDYAGAERILQTVLAITPNDPLLLRGLATLNLERGELAAAVENAHRAWLGDRSAPANIETLVAALQAVGAIEQAEAVLAQLPTGAEAQLPLQQQLALYREPVRLLPEVQDRLARSRHGGERPPPVLLQLAAWASIGGGDADTAIESLLRLRDGLEADAPQAIEADGLLLALGAGAESATARDWEQLARDREVERGGSASGAFETALLYASARRMDAALTWLERAVQAGFSDATRLRHDPRFAAVHADARFTASLRQAEQRVASERSRVRIELR